MFGMSGGLGHERLLKGLVGHSGKDFFDGKGL